MLDTRMNVKTLTTHLCEKLALFFAIDNKNVLHLSFIQEAIRCELYSSNIVSIFTNILDQP